MVMIPPCNSLKYIETKNILLKEKIKESKKDEYQKSSLNICPRFVVPNSIKDYDKTIKTNKLKKKTRTRSLF